MTVPGRSFDETASTYADVRPDYPEAALDWLLPAAGRQVLDLGAGTGKLTRQLVDRGLDVLAVEPSPEMGAQLVAAVPSAVLYVGAAEAIPRPDHSVDAVLVASAFHSFDPVQAMAEIGRVLRPGGRLGLLGNHPDEQTPWVAALAEITDAATRRQARRGPPEPSPGFDHVERASFTHPVASSREHLLDLIRTHSYYLTRDTAGRRQLLARVGALVDSHPDLAGRDRFDLPFRTRCWRARRT